jgi:lysophospholipase L1-like esterase
MKKSSVVVAFIMLTVILITGCSDKPRILIIGDSISGGYTPYVQEYFKDKATVVRISENGKHAGYGLKRIKEYIGDEKWDIIHFNYGLHDLCYRHRDSKLYGGRDKIKGKLPYDLNKYEENLDSLVRVMKELSDAKLIFLTTTYVPENEGGRFAKDAIIYNGVAKKVMNKHHVIINDIYEQSIEIHKKHGLGDDDVHYTEEGSKMLAKVICEFLEAEFRQ